MIIGGVNSPSRSFRAVGGGAPVTMSKGRGAYLFDVDGNRYIDYLAAYGPIIAGHAHPRISEAVREALEEGTLFGTPTPWETRFAERLREAIPSMERVRLVNSGTEAVMSALRVARAYTGRDKVLKFEGCYHGHADPMLVAAGSGPSSLGVPDSAGVPESTARETVTVPFNDVPAFEEAFGRLHGELACVIVEPVVGNFGIVTPEPGFLEALREHTTVAGIPLIFDEVISAFRFRYGAARPADVEPDITVLGKIIGGGLPIGAYGGRQSIMEKVAPLGPAYQAGTLAGNPASVRAGLACLDILSEPGVYERLDSLGARLETGLESIAKRTGAEAVVNRLGGALTLYFRDRPVKNYAHAKAASSSRFSAFFRAMLDQGICLAPSKYEAWFITLAHAEKEIDMTLEAAEKAMTTAMRAPV